MSLIALVVVILVVGLLLWGAEQLPLDATVKNVLRVVVIVFLCLFLLQAVGVLGPIGDIRIK